MSTVTRIFSDKSTVNVTRIFSEFRLCMNDNEGVPNGSGVVISLQRDSDGEYDDDDTADDNDDDDEFSNSGSSGASRDKNRLGADLFPSY